MTDPISDERLAEIRKRCENGADSLELLLDCVGNGINVLDHTSKGRDNWINDLKRYQADHVGLLAYVDELRDKLSLNAANELTRMGQAMETEAALRQQIVDADGRAIAAETERDVAVAERDQARAELASLRYEISRPVYDWAEETIAKEQP